MSKPKKDSQENKKYWKLALETRKKIEEWPEWKRNIRIQLTEYSTGTQRKESGIEADNC